MHSYRGRAAPSPPGSYRVRITARNPRGKKAVRGTTVQVAPRRRPSPPRRAHIASRSQAPYNFGGPDARFGAPRTGHIHQGQDVAAAEGTPLVAPGGGHDHVARYQAGGAGYYLVLDADGEDYNYVYMHLQRAACWSPRATTSPWASSIANVGNTGGSEGPHLHFEVWDGPWYSGGHPVDPLPFLKSWQ